MCLSTTRYELDGLVMTHVGRCAHLLEPETEHGGEETKESRPGSDGSWSGDRSSISESAGTAVVDIESGEAVEHAPISRVAQVSGAGMSERAASAVTAAGTGGHTTRAAVAHNCHSGS